MHEFDHGNLGNRVTLAARLHDQRRHDRKRQRDLDRERRTAARSRLQIDGTADLVDIRLDHVHTDAAA